MKLMPPSLLAALNKAGTSTCFLVKIVSVDGTKRGFTTLDADITLDDGAGMLTYSAEQELRPQNIQQEATYDSDNTELTGWFAQAVEDAVLSGAFDAAEVTIYRAAYLSLPSGLEVVGYGVIGQVDFSADDDGKRKVEFLGLTQLLQRHIIDLYSLTCRADFGDERCGMPFVWATATVSAVGDNPQTMFTITGVSQPDHYYDLGLVLFTDNENSGNDTEIESWNADGSLVLSFPTAFAVQVGDQLKIRQDCDKTFTSCKAYGNVVNMRAEHLTPTEDKSIMVPGAYVKSSGAQ